jgi:uncharacterized membrane protein
MNIIGFLKLYFLSLIIFLGIDAVWLTVIAKNFYTKYIGHLMSAAPNLPAALVFYLLYIIGIVVFCVIPNVGRGSVINAVMLGALFGLCAYATYDLTNFATLKNWPLIVVVTDLAWGTFITAAVAGLTAFISQKFL